MKLTPFQLMLRRKYTGIERSQMGDYIPILKVKGDSFLIGYWTTKHRCERFRDRIAVALSKIVEGAQ